ncbi:Protein of unknown function [Gryllus bimaculatus]|nr:Protein of unknown function [Gryllus bimaculatus]
MMLPDINNWLEKKYIKTAFIMCILKRLALSSPTDQLLLLENQQVGTGVYNKKLLEILIIQMKDTKK